MVYLKAYWPVPRQEVQPRQGDTKETGKNKGGVREVARQTVRYAEEANAMSFGAAYRLIEMS